MLVLRRIVLLVVPAFVVVASLGCGGLGSQIKQRQIAEMSVQVRSVPEGPTHDALAELLDAAWLSADDLGQMEVSGFGVELDRALDDGDITESELVSLRAKGARMVVPPGMDPAAVSQALAEKRKLEDEVAGDVEREAARKAARPPAPVKGAKFAGWTVPDEIATRAKGLGWELAHCDHDEIDRVAWTHCTFSKGDQVVEVELYDAERSDDARDDEEDYKAERTAVARDGTRILLVSVLDGKGALDLAKRVVPDGADLAGIGPKGVEAALTTAGWKLDDCLRHLEKDSTDTDCELNRTGQHGSYTFSGSTDRGDPAPPELEDGEVVVDHGSATLTLRVIDEKASVVFLNGLLGA